MFDFLSLWSKNCSALLLVQKHSQIEPVIQKHSQIESRFKREHQHRAIGHNTINAHITQRLLVELAERGLYMCDKEQRLEVDDCREVDAFKHAHSGSGRLYREDVACMIARARDTLMLNGARQTVCAAEWA